MNGSGSQALEFEGVRALVTGGASGIGAAIVAELSLAGAEVIAADLSFGQSAGSGTELGADVGGVAVDVADESSVKRLIEGATAHGVVNCLFNVAGIGSVTSAPDTPVEVWDKVMDVNARGTFLTCKHLVPHMVKAGGGSIVNMGSVAGLVGLKNRAAYCASKGAVIALTKALAVDHVYDGIRVNCVCPGTTDSPWVRGLVTESGESLEDLKARQPMGRLGTPEEIASAALYLASSRASFVTGSVFTIDGGLTAA